MTTERTPYAPLGEVPSGTMRTEDLIPAFLDVLMMHAPARYAELSADEPTWGDADDDYADPEDASAWLNDVLWPAMEELAPPFAYFGASEGDGACYGYWPDIDGLEQAARWNDDVVKVNWSEFQAVTIGDLHAVAYVKDGQLALADVSYVMGVTDHGNVTLYDARTDAEIWSVV